MIRVAFALVCLVLGPVSAQAKGCDRPCLAGIISKYLTALAGHDPFNISTTPSVKYVENDQILPLGVGEWPIVNFLGKYRHIFSDHEAGQVVVITTIVENGVGAIYIARLKVEVDRKIRERDSTRDPGGTARY